MALVEVCELHDPPPAPPFAHYSGHRLRPTIVFVGEAFGESEAECGRPFAGHSGRELFLMIGEGMDFVLDDNYTAARRLFHAGLGWIGARDRWLDGVGLRHDQCAGLRPPDNKIEALCVSKKELPNDYRGSKLIRGSILILSILANWIVFAMNCTNVGLIWSLLWVMSLAGLCWVPWHWRPPGNHLRRTTDRTGPEGPPDIPSRCGASPMALASDRRRGSDEGRPRSGLCGNPPTQPDRHDQPISGANHVPHRLVDRRMPRVRGGY